MKHISLQNTYIYLLIICGMLGCASMDRNAYSKFEPYDENGAKMFKFYSKSDIIYPANTEQGEKVRMQWLEKWLLDNNYCGAGYLVLERKPISIGGWESAKDIYYTGQCK